MLELLEQLVDRDELALVRDDDELERIVYYIRDNPVKAGLVERPEHWFWCSCHDRFLLDGDPGGWLP